MSFRESAILRKRARTFLRHAGESVKTKEFDFACFSAEQAAQLFVKSAMLEIIGEVPRSHSVREMLALLASSSPKNKKGIMKFMRENRRELRLMDDAYINSRYLPSEYTVGEAEILLDLSRAIRALMETVVKESRL